MTKRFTAIIIIANIIMGLLLYVSSQVLLLHLTATHPYLTVTGVDIDKIYIGAVQAPSSSIPLVITSYPNLPFYIFLLPLAANAYFIIKISRSSAKAKRLPVIIIVANIIMNLLIYYSSQSMFLSLVGSQGNYVRVGGVSFGSISVGAVSVGGSPIPLVIVGEPNLPSYVFMLFLIVNAYFIIRLKRTKES
jgi:ABC-type arginine transport system permease subunit